jgi:hypothetical protein
MAFTGSASGTTYNGGDNLNLTRWGANNATKQTGIGAAMSDHNLWLPTWSGEVLHAYDQLNMFEAMVDTRVLDNGISVEFPITGTVALTPAWEAGQELAGGGSSSTRFAIGLDRRPIAAHFELDNIDVMIEQFDFRSELARQAGMTLANERDRQIARLLVKGAQTASRMHTRDEDPYAVNSSGIDTRYGGRAYFINDTSAGTPDAWPNSEVGALNVLKAIEVEQVRARNLDLPEGELVVVVKPELFNQIRRLGIATVGASVQNTNSLFNVAGGRDDGKIFGTNTTQASMTASLSYLNATIYSSTHLPEDANYVTGTVGAGQKAANDANYAVNCLGFVGLMFRRGGVASIKKQGMKVDTVNDIRRNSVFTVASMFHGGGVLRPEFCAVLLQESVNATAGEQQSMDTVTELNTIYNETYNLANDAVETT